MEAVTSATVKVHEFTALAALKAPFAEKATVGGVEISRLALDGELIAGHAHARDLIWTDEFMRRYNSGATLGRTVRYCLTRSSPSRRSSRRCARRRRPSARS